MFYFITEYAISARGRCSDSPEQFPPRTTHERKTVPQTFLTRLAGYRLSVLLRRRRKRRGVRRFKGATRQKSFSLKRSLYLELVEAAHPVPLHNWNTLKHNEGVLRGTHTGIVLSMQLNRK